MQVGILLDELWREAVGKAKHILIDKHLTVAESAGADADRQCLRLFCDHLSQCLRHTLQGDGKSTSFFYGLGITEKLLGLFQ